MHVELHDEYCVSVFKTKKPDIDDEVIEFIDEKRKEGLDFVDHYTDANYLFLKFTETIN